MSTVENRKKLRETFSKAYKEDVYDAHNKIKKEYVVWLENYLIDNISNVAESLENHDINSALCFVNKLKECVYDKRI